MYSARKRQRAIISQEETTFRTEADEAEEDLVGLENSILGGDRSTAGTRLKSSKFPKSPGVYKGKKNITDLILKRAAGQLAPTVDFTLIEPDFDIKQAAGGYQMVFDAEHYIVRTVTGTTNLGMDTLTTLGNKLMHTAHIKMFRNAYRKIGTDVGAGWGAVDIETTNSNENQAPSLFVSGFVNTKTLNNLGTNTVVVELWDMICIKDTDMAPLSAWNHDLYNGNYGSEFSGAVVTPNTAAADRSWGDPGVRPNKRTDKILFQHWDTMRITRYILRPGQTIHHIVALPSTELSQNTLYAWNSSGNDTITHDYVRNISCETLGFAIGELCFDETASSQKIACSSVYLQGRSKWEFKARSLPRLRSRFNCTTDMNFANPTNRLSFYPSIPNVDQKILSQTTGLPLDVTDQDAANLDTA